MKKINFTNISIKNFLSTGEEPIDIDFSDGFNIITGFNKDENDIKNGVGKTLIIDALYFVIFGTTLRDLSKQAYIINRQNGKNCRVKLEFDCFTNNSKEHYVVERTLKPNSLSIFKDGEDKTKSAITETAKYLREVLSANEDVFKNCIVMRANNTTPFMLKNTPAKKSFIESIFNLSVFGDMLKEVKDDLKSAKQEYNIVFTEYSMIDNNKEKYQSEITKLKKTAETKAKQASQIISQIQEEINTYQKQIEELTDQYNKSENFDDKLKKQMEIKAQADGYYQKILQSKYQCDAKINNCESQLTKISKEGNICPTCKREFDESHKSHIEEIVKKLKDEAAQEKKNLVALKEKETKLKEIVDDSNKLIQELSTKRNEIRYIAKRISDIKQLIISKQQQIKLYTSNSESESIKSFEEMLKKTQEDLKNKKKDVTKWEDEINKLNICEHILGEYGIRAYIVNKLLELLNNRITFYLNKLKSTFKFSFNELFEDEIKDSNGSLCSYGNCSGAEMKKIDLAISFAFLDILKFQQQLEYNVLFLDEILDSSLDTKSLEYVVSFLSDYVSQNNIGLYLITHKSDVNLPNINKMVVLEKKNSFSRLLEIQS